MRGPGPRRVTGPGNNPGSLMPRPTALAGGPPAHLLTRDRVRRPGAPTFSPSPRPGNSLGNDNSRKIPSLLIYPFGVAFTSFVTGVFATHARHHGSLPGATPGRPAFPDRLQAVFRRPRCFLGGVFCIWQDFWRVGSSDRVRIDVSEPGGVRHIMSCSCLR